MTKNNDLSEILAKQVKIFEEGDHDLSEVPQELIDSYGYACLANALMFKFPKFPKYNKDISEQFKKKEFKTLESLISFIKGYKDEMDRLFAIFCWASLNIEYDAQQLLSGDHKPTSLEIVFKTKKAVCEGFALFFIEMAKKVDIDQKRIVIKHYSCFSKAFGFDPLHPPKNIKSDHASVYLTIDGVPFISEPTWASGHITASNKFEWNFRPELFLVPLYSSLCDHFPMDECQNLLPFKYTFPQFFQSCKIYAFDRYLKTETHPLVNFTIPNGYLESVYSCTGPIDFISIKIHVEKKTKKSSSFNQIDINGITSYQVIQAKLPKHPERCRFRTCISFPKEGFYKVEMFVNGPSVQTYFVKALKKSQGSCRVQYNPFHESRFIPISPKTINSTVTGGYARIRFAVIPKRSTLLWDIFKIKSGTFQTDGQNIDRKYGSYIQLNIPFDDERYEDQLGITFPFNGRYCVSVYLSKDEPNSFSLYTNYFFDVSGVQSEDPDPVSPVYYLPKGRTFSPSAFTDRDGHKVGIKPDQSLFYVTKTEQSIEFKTHSPSDEIYLEFRKGDTTVAFPTEDGKNGQFRKYSWSIPDEEGSYRMCVWINDKYSFAIPYFYSSKELGEPTDDENRLMSELKKVTDQDETKLRRIEEERKRKEDEERKRMEDEKCKQQMLQQQQQSQQEQQDIEENLKKKDSKCCLLI